MVYVTEIVHTQKKCEHFGDDDLRFLKNRRCLVGGSI